MSRRNEALKVLRNYRNNILQFVGEQFKIKPDPWQEKALVGFGNINEKLWRQSLQACAGPGKSAVLAWCGLWFLVTQGERGNHPKGAVTACTEANLKDNLWTEYSKWNDISPLCSGILKWTKTRLFAKDHPNTWFLSARAFNNSADAEQKGRVLSGIHSKYMLFQVDESGDVPITVMKTAEQALSTSDMVFGRVQQAGNPTSVDGMLYAVLDDGEWQVIKITGDPLDPERSTRVSLKVAESSIRKYTRQDPWVMAYILGQFPKGGINTLFSAHDVDEAMKRGVHENDYKKAQKRMGIDVARFGLDSTVIFPRQGLRAFNYVEMRDARTDEIASRVIAGKRRWGSELEFVDGTGGYGAGVVDSMIRAGASPYEINFAAKADDRRYYNKRAEMWFRFANWCKRGGMMPKCVSLKKELISQTYGFKGGKMILEDKELIRKRLGFSPDRGDALALTFAIEEMPAAIYSPVNQHRQLKSKYDPLHER